MRTDLLCHYPSSGARRADLVVHVVGVFLSVLGGSVMLYSSIENGNNMIYSVSIYSCALVLMIIFSFAYNLSSGKNQIFLRKLDHIGIFVLIAGTYTPLTTVVLSGNWAWGMTILVWGLAGLGIYSKATSLDLPDIVWTGIYVGLGWLALVAIQPIARHVSGAAIALLAIGGVIYTTGAAFYVLELPKFWRSIWHGHVITAAGFHWAGIFIALFCPPFVGGSNSGTGRPAMTIQLRERPELVIPVVKATGVPWGKLSKPRFTSTAHRAT